MLQQQEKEKLWALTEAFGFALEPVREAVLSLGLVLVEAVYRDGDVEVRVRV